MENTSHENELLLFKVTTILLTFKQMMTYYDMCKNKHRKMSVLMYLISMVTISYMHSSASSSHDTPNRETFMLALRNSSENNSQSIYLVQIIENISWTVSHLDSRTLSIERKVKQNINTHQRFMQKNIERLEQEIRGYKSIIHELIKHNNELIKHNTGSDIADIKIHLQAIYESQTRQTEYIEKLEGRTVKYHTNINRALELVIILQGSITTLVAELNRLGSELTELRSELTELRSELNELRKEFKGLKIKQSKHYCCLQ